MKTPRKVNMFEVLGKLDALVERALEHSTKTDEIEVSAKANLFPATRLVAWLLRKGKTTFTASDCLDCPWFHDCEDIVAELIDFLLMIHALDVYPADGMSRIETHFMLDLECRVLSY